MRAEGEEDRRQEEQSCEFACLAENQYWAYIRKNVAIFVLFFVLPVANLGTAWSSSGGGL